MLPESSRAAVPVQLDLANERLWCGTQVRVLRPKTFALLRYLVEHPDQLLTKHTLLEALWPETAVSEVVLSVCIRELRQALGDDAKTPHFIETVHRRGYRFIGHVPLVPPSALHTAAPTPPPLLVGREHALDALHRELATALTGVRQILFVTGEAGLGKTTLVDAFLTAVEGQGALWIGRGQCLDHYGAGEAYLPILEALEQLCQGPAGPDLVKILRHQAPTWVVQMPGLVSAAELEDLQRRVLGSTRERMLRELAEALTVLTAARPLVLVLEDLHWSDYATLDALAALARRREPARLLLLGTYRPPDALQRGHPLPTVMHELHLHGQCAELALPWLSEAAVDAYLAARFPDAQLPAGLARLVHQRTEGNPLFMVQVVEDWVRRGWLVQVGGRWTLRVGRAALAVAVPDGLRQMLEQHLDRLSPLEHQVLEAGSVAGITFSAAAVAAGLAREVIPVEACCARLARRRQWLEACGEQSWPDGTVAGAYRFTHALYQEVAYARLSAARRAQLHRRIGAREEVGYGPQARERAAVLAVHFARGRDPRRALRYLQDAADNALRRFAYPDAIAHLTDALALLTTLPETPERARHELAVQAALGPALMAIKGYAAPEVAQAYARARALCQRGGDTPQRFAVLLGLCIFYQERAALQTASMLAAQLLQLAQRLQDPVCLLWAHNALGITLKFMGELVDARAHLEASLRLYTPDLPRTYPVVFDPGVDSLCGLAELLSVQGYPDQAVQRSHEALALARRLAHPLSLAVALGCAARIHRRRGASQAAQALEEASLALGRAQGFAQGVAQETVWQGWDLVTRGRAEAGLVQMRQGIDALRATGAELERPWLLSALARAYGRTGRATEGLAVVAEALAIVDHTGKHLDESGLYRTKGELLLVQAGTSDQAYTIRPQVEAAAEACFEQALTIARRQQARALELQAAMSLARLWQRQGRRAEAHARLASVYGWFTEGFDTIDLQEATTLLAELGG
jgi:DNA-binding winged helix-turn-helix (wHTH) protein/tetratricopeptide (TPR) repeat protein